MKELNHIIFALFGQKFSSEYSCDGAPVRSVECILTLTVISSPVLFQCDTESEGERVS